MTGSLAPPVSEYHRRTSPRSAKSSFVGGCRGSGIQLVCAVATCLSGCGVLQPDADAIPVAAIEASRWRRLWSEKVERLSLSVLGIARLLPVLGRIDALGRSLSPGGLRRRSLGGRSPFRRRLVSVFAPVSLPFGESRDEVDCDLELRAARIAAIFTGIGLSKGSRLNRVVEELEIKSGAGATPIEPFSQPGGEI